MYASSNPYTPPAQQQQQRGYGYGYGYGSARPEFVRLGWRMILAAIAIIGTTLVSLGLDATSLAYAEELKDPETNLGATLLVGVFGLSLVAAHIAAAVFFCMFVHRASKNLLALGHYPQFTPGWAVGWFFVPFANLVKPVQAVSEIWRLSDPGGRGSGLLAAWWGAWIVSNVIANVSARIDDPSTSASIGLFGTAVMMIAGLFAVLVMRGIAKRQDAARDSLGPSPSPGY